MTTETLRHTVTHYDTDEALFPGDGERRDKALAILLTKPGLVLSEWCVTAWIPDALDAYGVPEISWQVNAQEFVDCGGRVRP